MDLIKQNKKLMKEVQTNILSGVTSRRALTKYRVKRTTRGILEMIGRFVMIGMILGVFGIFAIFMLLMLVV